MASSAEVAGLLQPGTNVITAWVTNAVGPPALWLLLKNDRFSLGTSERWQVSLSGTEWQSARNARQPLDFKPDSSLHGSTWIMDSLKRAWPLELAFCAGSLALVWGINRWLRHKRVQATTLPARTSSKLIYGLLVIVLMARTALFLNNLPQLPRKIGFDATEHEQYIQFIQEKHALPFADDGWEMFQPPLYYLASTLVLDGCGRFVGDEDAVYLLRAVNGVIGLLHCWLVFLCLRLLFWGSLQAQAAGLLVAAFLPPHLYLSQYVTNEPLAGFLVTVAIYLCLRVLRAEREGLWMLLGIGVALGAAMLAKVSVLVSLPFFPVALSQRLAARREHAWRDWLRSVGAVVAGCLIVSRLVLRTRLGTVRHADHRELGCPVRAGGTGQGWLDPGFRTSAFYSSFGRALVSPAFSGFHSFADGIYSTLWGDGLGSSMGGIADPTYQPPWNFDLMGAGYWVSLGISLLLIIGVALTLAKLIRQTRAEWFLVFGIACGFGLAVVWFSLCQPNYGSSKAFYAFPALLPFSALVALGWDWLRQRHQAVGVAVWVLLLVWSITVYTSFWVRNWNPETQFVRAIELGSTLMHQGKLDEAIRQFQEATRLKADRANAHNNLGIVLGEKGQIEEAISQFQEAIRLEPGYAEAHNNLGTALGMKGQFDEAIRQYQAALRLKPDYAGAHNNLGTALARKGQIDEAIGQLQEALRLKPDYADARRNLDAALAAQANASHQPGASTNR